MAIWILKTPKDSDDDAVSNAGKLVLNSLPDIKRSIRESAAQIAKDGDLSDKGKSKRVAKAAVEGISRFREAQSRISRELIDERTKVQNRTKDKIPGASQESKFHIAQWLRSLPMSERNTVLREAASGKMAGGDEVMAAVVSSFPRLIGCQDTDPIVQLVRDEWLSRVAPNSIVETVNLDEAETALRLAAEELESFAAELSPDFPEALAVMEGKKPWSSLTVAEKSEAIDDGGDIADLMKRGVEKTDADYERDAVRAQKAEEDAKFANMTLAEKVAAVQQAAE